MLNILVTNSKTPFQTFNNLVKEEKLQFLHDRLTNVKTIRDYISKINNAIKDSTNIWRSMLVEQALGQICPHLQTYLLGIHDIIPNYNPYTDKVVINLFESLNNNIDSMKSIPFSSNFATKALKIFRAVEHFAFSIDLIPTPENYKLAEKFENWKTEISLSELEKQVINALNSNNLQTQSIIAFAMRNGFTHNNMHLIESLIQWRVKNPEKNFIGEGGYFYNDLDGWGNGMAPLITELTALIDRIFQKNIVGVVES